MHVSIWIHHCECIAADLLNVRDSWSLHKNRHAGVEYHLLYKRCFNAYFSCFCHHVHSVAMEFIWIALPFHCRGSHFVHMSFRRLWQIILGILWIWQTQLIIHNIANVTSVLIVDIGFKSWKKSTRLVYIHLKLTCSDKLCTCTYIFICVYVCGITNTAFFNNGIV